MSISKYECDNCYKEFYKNKKGSIRIPKNDWFDEPLISIQQEHGISKIHLPYNKQFCSMKCLTNWLMKEFNKKTKKP